MLNHLMCEKISFPCIEIEDDDALNSATIFQKDCAHENCAACEAFARSELSVFSCPT